MELGVSLSHVRLKLERLKWTLLKSGLDYYAPKFILGSNELKIDLGHDPLNLRKT